MLPRVRTTSVDARYESEFLVPRHQHHLRVGKKYSLRTLPRLTELESAFQQDPWVILIYS